MITTKTSQIAPAYGISRKTFVVTDSTFRSSLKNVNSSSYISKVLLVLMLHDLGFDIPLTLLLKVMPRVSIDTASRQVAQCTNNSSSQRIRTNTVFNDHRVQFKNIVSLQTSLEPSTVTVIKLYTRRIVYSVHVILMKTFYD